jgi:Fungal specific transcription factor domain
MEALIKFRSTHQCNSAEYLALMVEWYGANFVERRTYNLAHQCVSMLNLLTFLCRVDLVDASSNLTKPRLSPHQPRTQNLNIADEEEFHARLDAQWGPEFPADPVMMLDGMDNTTAKLFHRVRQLSALANSMAESKVHPEVQIRYNQAIQLLERQVVASIWSLNLNNIRQHGSATRPKQPITVRTCTRTWHCTTLIFIHMVLRKTPPSSQIVEKLVRRAKFSMQILTPEELWIYFPHRFLLWVLIIVGIASAGHGDRLWLLQTLKQLQQRLSLESWEAAKTIVVQFAWVDRLCARPASLIWKELEIIEL